jgi:N-acyl homoserine lactone hydrolase
MSVRLYAMTCGWLTMPMPMLMRGKKGRLKIPVPAYFVRHPKGTVLFDSGMSMRVQRDGAKALGSMEPYFDVHFEPNEEIAARLAAVDMDAGKIDYLVSSHLHFDHCGGNEMIENARWVVQKREWEAASIRDTDVSQQYNPKDFDHGHDRVEADGEHDLFGDGTVRCIPTHGHTPGHQSLLVETDSGPIVMCGDACYLRQTLEEMWLPATSVVHDEPAMQASLQRLRTLQQGGARLMYGHDPDFWQDIPQAPIALG